MRKLPIVALSVGLVLVVGGGASLTKQPTAPCLLPSNDAGFTEDTPVICVNTGRLATSKDIAAGNYYQHECKPGLPVACAEVTLAVWRDGRVTRCVSTIVPSVARSYMRRGFVPVPETECYR